MVASHETNVAQRLEAAWQQLVGSKLAFAEHSLDYAEHAGDLHAVIPVQVPTNPVPSGIALRVSKTVATELASQLFGVAPDEVDDSQRIDVCGELCNILCSCVTPLFAAQDEIEMGVPRSVDFVEFQNILAKNDVASLYEAAPGDGNVTVVIVNAFTPLETAAPAAAPVTVDQPHVVETGKPMKFLIVDDSRAIQTIVRRAVEKSGLPNMEFRAASNGEEALKVVNEWGPNLIITDWHMPGMSGIDLLKFLKAEHGHIRVGFVTTEASPKKLEEAHANGAEFVLRKPFADDELIAEISKVLGKVSTGLDGPSVRTVDVDTLTRFFCTTLNQTVSLTVASPCALDEIQAPWVIGLYAIDGKNDIRGFCLFDWSAVVFLGSTLANLSGSAITGSMSDPRVAQKLYEHAASVLTESASTLFSGVPGQKIVLARSQLVQDPPEKLKEIMQKSRGRNDFILAQGDLPLGRITLIAR